MLDKNISKLGRSEKILLAEDLWDSTSKKGVPINADEKIYVKDRISSLVKRKYKSRDWASIKREIGI